MLFIIESTSTTTPPQSTPATAEPQPDILSEKPIPTKKERSETISELFRTKAPKEILPELHQLGFTSINECRCCPQLSRKKDEPADNPDVREIIETELPKTAAQKFKTEEPLTVLSMGPGRGFEDLVQLSKFKEKGFKDINWILVDPFYNKGTGGCFTKEKGQETLEQIYQIATSILPRIRILIIDSVQEIAKFPIAATADVFFDFDDGLLGQKTIQDYLALVQTMEKYIHSLSKPVIYLHSTKKHAGYTFNKQTQSIQEKVQVIVTEQYISSKDDSVEKRLLVDSTMPCNTVPADQGLFIHFIMSDDYDAVKYCIEKGCNPHFLQGDLSIAMTLAQRGSFQSLKALVEIGHVSLTTQDNDGRTALHYAAVNNSPKAAEIIDYLVEKGADVNAQTKYKMTPLFDAVALRRTPAILALLKNGARLDIQDHMGRTPLPWIQELLQAEPRNLTEAEHFKQIQELIAQKTTEPTPTTQTTEDSTQTTTTTLTVASTEK